MERREAQFNIIGDYYAEHAGELRVFVRGRIKFSDEADDIVQDIFLKLLTAQSALMPGTLAGLAYAMARNRIYDYYRHRRSVEEYISYAGHDGASRVTEPADCSAAEIRELLERGIARLREGQRRVYRMSVYDGLPVSGISAALNMKYKTAENRLGAARKAVRQYMTRMLA